MLSGHGSLLGVCVRNGFSLPARALTFVFLVLSVDKHRFLILVRSNLSVKMQMSSVPHHWNNKISIRSLFLG